MRQLCAKASTSTACQKKIRFSINIPKSVDWKQDLRQPCAIRKASHPAAVERHGTSSAPAKRLRLESMRGHVALAELHAFVGDMDKSIKEWQTAYQIAQSDVPGAIPYMQEALGVSVPASLRDGKWSLSRVGQHLISSLLCAQAHFDKPENSKLAIQYFRSYLERRRTIWK